MHLLLLGLATEENCCLSAQGGDAEFRFDPNLGNGVREDRRLDQPFVEPRLGSQHSLRRIGKYPIESLHWHGGGHYGFSAGTVILDSQSRTVATKSNNTSSVLPSLAL